MMEDQKGIALLVVRGVNCDCLLHAFTLMFMPFYHERTFFPIQYFNAATIFAYGKTSSGKRYTMNGITEYTVADIYDYIQKHEERAFVLIYNEVVRDLSSDNSPLRLLDDLEKGTIIEKLTKETRGIGIIARSSYTYVKLKGKLERLE